VAQHRLILQTQLPDTDLMAPITGGGRKHFSSIYHTTYSSMSTKDKSIRIQCYSVFPGQIASNFVPAYQLQSGDESKHARQQGERGISKGKACNVSLTHHKFSWDEN